MEQPTTPAPQTTIFGLAVSWWRACVRACGEGSGGGNRGKHRLNPQNKPARATLHMVSLFAMHGTAMMRVKVDAKENHVAITKNRSKAAAPACPTDMKITPSMLLLNLGR